MIVEQKNTLKFLIRGIREHSDKEMDFVYERLREIHQEILYGNMYEKSEGVLKLWYLNMLGYDISFGFFSIIQVMSFSLFELRRPAFFAAACCFHNKTPMALLCINTFKKILSQSVDNASTCLALSCLGCLRIHDMGRDLHQDVVALLLSSNLSVKHKAILCSYRMIKLFPSTIQSILPKIKDLLNHENSLIVTATISLLLELVQENTVSYLFLVPTLFKCWSHSTSSWQILKLLKLFRIFCSYESRLAPKLQDTITQILNTSSSKSVEYEIFCIVIQFFPSTLPIVSLCLTRLKNSYVNSHDMNLVLMGLEFIANEVLGNPCMVNLLEQIFEHQLIPQVCFSKQLLKV
jgi:AP-3 complex subunit delta